MIRKCPYCHIEMTDDCYVRDKATALNDFVIIEKDNNYKKIEHVIKAAICKKCGHIEMYIENDE